MSDIESTRAAILDFLTGFASVKSSVVSRLRNAVTQSDKTLYLNNANNDANFYSDDDEEEDYGMSLKQYNNLSSYVTVMNSLYGNTSKTKFQSALNNVLNAGQNSQISSAKNFVQKMRESGLSNSAALTMFKAVNSYSLVSNMQNGGTNSFISIKT